MAYRRPAIEVIQEFQQAAAALALPALPACVVGPAFQIVTDADAGTYSETTIGPSSYAYPGLAVGGVVDLTDTPTDEADANAHKSVGVKLVNLYLVKIGQQTTGQLRASNLFHDNTGNAFATIDPTAVGAPTFYVEVVSGAGVSDADLGRKLVIGKNSDNELIVAANWQSGGLPLSTITYRVLEFRKAETYPVDDLVGSGIAKTPTAVVINQGLVAVSDGLAVVEGTVDLSWRALRTDLAGTLTAFTTLASLEAVFGIGTIVPANCGPFVVNDGLQNTTTAVNFVGLGAEFFTAEEDAYQSALEFLESKDVYGVIVLSSLPAVHQLLKAHVEGMSDPAVGRERYGLFGRKLVTREVVVPPDGSGTITTSGTNNGTSGTANKIFKDPDNGAFVSDALKAGDVVVISDYADTQGTDRTITPKERDYVDNGNSRVQLINGAFLAGDIGRFIIVRGATTAANNQTPLQITAATSLVKAAVTPAPSTSEVLPGGSRAWIASLSRTIVHNAADAVVAATKTWSFANAAFTGADVGRLLFMAGAAAAGDNGAFTIATVVNGTTVTTVEAPGADETFGGGVTQKIFAIVREPVRDVTADSVNGATRTWTIINGAFSADDIGRKLHIAGANNAGNNADHLIDAVFSLSSVHTTVATTPVTEEFNGIVTPTITETVIALAPSATEAAFIKQAAGHVIDSITSESELVFAADPTGGFAGTLQAVVYQVLRPLSKDDQAAFLAGYATSFGTRRLSSLWPDVIKVSVNGTVTKVPGYFAGGAFVGMIAGLPSQAGFTNLSLVGFVGVQHSNDYFSDTQLDVIAGGGNLILTQPVPDAALAVRHQLTTDVSTIFFQELSVTKNVDLIARFFRGHFRPYIGIYNITDTLLDLLKTRGEGGITFLQNQRAARVGAPLRSGQLTRIEESTTQPDSVEIDIGVNVPLPLNNIKLTLLV